MTCLAAGEQMTEAVWLDRYRADLRGLSDEELAHRAYTLAALPGRMPAELRRLVDAEQVFRQATRREAAGEPRRLGWARLIAGVPLLLAAPAAFGYASYLTGQEMTGRIELPQQTVWAPVVAAVGAGVAVTAAAVGRWREYLRYRHNELLDEADLDPAALALLQRVRAQRGEAS